MSGSLARLARRTLAPLYGVPAAGRRGGIGSNLANTRLFLVAALLPLVLGAAICLAVVAVDPFDLRPWGLQPRFFDGNYPELVTPRLVRAVTHQHQDVILVGGSQAMGVTPDQLRRAFEARDAFNLSYSLLEARDLDAVSHAAVRTPGLKRLIVELPFTVTDWDRPPAATGRGALAVLHAQWFALPDFGEDIFRGSIERLTLGSFVTPDWRRQSTEFLGRRTLPQNATLMTQLRAAFGNIPPAAFTRSAASPCARFGVIDQALVPLMKNAASRDVELDLYFPPIPPASYPRAEVQQSGENAGWFDSLTSFHRCTIVAATRAAMPNVHVLAIDVDPAIIGDLTNYKDTFHLVRPEKFDRLLDDVRAHRFEVSGTNADEYLAKLSENVLSEYRNRGRR